MSIGECRSSIGGRSSFVDRYPGGHWRPIARSCAAGAGSAILALTVSAGCTSPDIEATAGAGAPSPVQEAANEGDPEDSLPPPGYGTLRQDDFTIAFSSGPVQIKVTPLAEEVIRLAAPDTYQRLHGMVASRGERIERAAARQGAGRDPRLFLVSFFTIDRQATFIPTDLHIFSQGVLHRPLDILPLTSGWGQQQLRQEQTQSGIYLFRGSIDLDVDLRVEYQGSGTSAWARIIHVLQSERARVMARSSS